MVGDFGDFGDAELAVQGGVADVELLGVEDDALFQQFLEVLPVAGHPFHVHLAAGEEVIEGGPVAVFQAAAEGHAAEVAELLPVEGQALEVEEHKLLVEQGRAEEEVDLPFALVHPHGAGVELARRRVGIGPWPGQEAEADAVAFIGKHIADQVGDHPVMLEFTGKIGWPVADTDL